MTTANHTSTDCQKKKRGRPSKALTYRQQQQMEGEIQEETGKCSNQSTLATASSVATEIPLNICPLKTTLQLSPQQMQSQTETTTTSTTRIATKGTQQCHNLGTPQQLFQLCQKPTKLGLLEERDRCHNQEQQEKKLQQQEHHDQLQQQQQQQQQGVLQLQEEKRQNKRGPGRPRGSTKKRKPSVCQASENRETSLLKQLYTVYVNRGLRQHGEIVKSINKLLRDIDTGGDSCCGEELRQVTQESPTTKQEKGTTSASYSLGNPPSASYSFGNPPALVHMVHRAQGPRFAEADSVSSYSASLPLGVNTIQPQGTDFVDGEPLNLSKKCVSVKNEVQDLLRTHREPDLNDRCSECNRVGPQRNHSSLAWMSDTGVPQLLTPTCEIVHVVRDVTSWDVEDVVKFVAALPGCQEYAEAFRENCIRGAVLLDLSEEHLTSPKYLNMKLGPALVLQREVAKLFKKSSG